MEPGAPSTRPSTMRPSAMLAALGMLLVLAGCGSGGDHEPVVSDPAPTSASPATASPTTASPTASPTVGSYPDFEPSDYSYELTMQCFCAFGGSPVDVTVAGGKVVRAVYAKSSTGPVPTHAGDPAPDSMWLTINDIIAKANDTAAARVTVDWPAGQDYPSSVQVDNHADVADDEVGYTISDVQVR